MPPPREPVKPTALMRGSATSAAPSSSTGAERAARTRLRAGRMSATAAWIARPTSSRGARVGRMRLDHDRAAGRERRGGVAARDREREREVAGAEHRDRAERDLAQAQVRARQRLALRQRRVDARVEPLAVAHHLGEQPQLADGAAALAFEAGARQAGLGRGALDQRVADLQDVVGDGLEESARVPRGRSRDRCRRPPRPARRRARPPPARRRRTPARASRRSPG